MPNLTTKMLEELSSVEFLTVEQACLLAKQAFADYTKRTNLAKQIDKRVFDMCLAGGCPNAVYNAVFVLVQNNK